ncbi:MAG: hypothetical protein IPP94_08210 [Ignavibacteria bacterium]|nr:hypothetical protein [Ignavibacteria bacterium]
MRISYSRWVAQAETRQERMENLISLFSQLLMQTGGDVREAIDWLEELDREHDIFTADLTMQDFVDELKKRGFIAEDRESGALEVTSKGNQRIRQDALQDVFSSLKKSPDGMHDTPHSGNGVERTSETKKYRFGDSVANIDMTSTLRNAYARGGIEGFSLEEEDVEVYETEHQTSAATVLMLDISHSMILYGEDRITPAKQIALALAELILTRYPKDRLHILLFGDDAVEVGIKDLPFVSVGPFHTNTREGLRLARSLLRRAGNANKQIFMVTDGKPSAIFEDDGRLYKNSFGLDLRIVNKTLDEAMACRREQIAISTFMVARDPALVEFVEEMTKANKGRAYFTGLGRLGEFVLVDYIRNRKKTGNL